MATTLVIRLSSLGDVAILIPVLYSVAKRNPDDQFLLVTKKPLFPLFVNKPDNLTIFPVHTKDKHKGFVGLLRGIGDINATIAVIAGLTRTPLSVVNKIKVADLHDVIRSGIIDSYYRLKGAKIAVINKSRIEKRNLVRQNRKKFVPLKTSLERYQEVFEKLGYDASVDFTSLFAGKDRKAETRIGVAPFAKHRGKIYPPEQMEEVIRILNERPNTKIFLFGGKEESDLLEHWTEKYASVESIAGQLSFHDELFLMNSLDVMVSMDSANMHLASLVDTPVVSIWGATHPYAGFYGFNQNPENAVQIELPCRPCSVFGDKPCYRGDYACLKRISPEMIVNKIKENIC